MCCAITTRRDRAGTARAGGRRRLFAMRILRHILFLFLGFLTGGHAVVPEMSGAKISAKYEGFLKDHCLGCHDAEKSKGNFRMDQLPWEIGSVESAERWQKVLNALNSGEMPPEGERQPDRVVKTDFLEHLASEMVVARKALADTRGQITLRRLNRREYRNTIREVLGVDVNPSELPPDGSPSAFDTVGSSLFMSSSQFDSYRQLGRRAVDAAFELFESKQTVRRHRIEPEERVNQAVESQIARQSSIRKRVAMWTREVDAASRRPENAKVVSEIRAAAVKTTAGPQDPLGPHAIYHAWERVSGAPAPIAFGFVDAVDVFHHQGQWNTFIPHLVDYLSLPKFRSGVYLSGGTDATRSITCAVPGDWPAGDYRLRVRAAFVGQLSLVPSRTELKPTLASAPLQVRRFLEVAVGQSDKVHSTHHLSGTMEDPQEILVPFSVEKTGNRHLQLREASVEHRLPNGDSNPAIWIDWMEWEGPFNPLRPTPAALAALGFPWTTEMTDDGIEERLKAFCVGVFRGSPPSPDHLAKLLSLYAMRRALGEKPSVAIRTPLAVVLSSPRFLYLAEPVKDGERRPLTGRELATRLSYLLWSAPPDVVLMEKAQSGVLQEPAVLLDEVERMLASDKSREWVTGFTRQWLSMDRLDFFMFSPKRFPAFSPSVKEAAREEIFSTVGWLLRSNGSLSHLLSSDHAVVNGLLAQYYGWEDVTGDAFRPVKVPQGSPRGGLLGMAAIHAMGSDGERSSPVERGAWVLRKMLFTPPPPAPPNVPQLNRLEGQLLTTRERLSAHQEDPQCASCHRKIDPIGFGLENFDAVGQWRTEDGYERQGVGSKRWEIDPAGALHKGPSFSNYFELRRLIAENPDGFARGFTEALIEYALGRPCGFSDGALVERIVLQAKQKGFAVREFFRALVVSPEFQSK